MGVSFRARRRETEQTRGGRVRTAVSTLLMILASVLVLGAVTGSLVDRMAHTEGPTRDIAASLPHDDAVRAALPPLVLHGILDQLPEGMPVPVALDGVLERASDTAVTAVLDSAGFQPAWIASVEESRRAYVDRLEDVRAGRVETAPAVLELGPLATQGVTRLKDGADALGLGMFAGVLPADVKASVQLDLQGTDQAGSQRIATVVWAAGFWGWALVLAVVAALAALGCARPRARGPVLAVGGLLTCIWAIVLLTHPWSAGPGDLTVAQPGAGPSVSEAAQLLGDAVRANVIRVVNDQLESAAVPCLVGGGIVVVAGVVIRLIEDRRRNG